MWQAVWYIAGGRNVRVFLFLSLPQTGEGPGRSTGPAEILWGSSHGTTCTPVTQLLRRAQVPHLALVWPDHDQNSAFWAGPQGGVGGALGGPRSGGPGWCQPKVGAIGPPEGWRNSGHQWSSQPLRAEKDFRMWVVESLAHKFQACGSLLSTLGQIVILWGLPFNSPSAYLTVHLELNTDHGCLETSSGALKNPIIAKWIV